VNKKKTPQNLQRLRFEAFFFPKIYFKCKDTVLVVGGKSKIVGHLNTVIKYYNLFLTVKRNSCRSICEIMFPFFL